MNLLDIKGIVLDKEQLKSYLENIASDHTLKNKSDKETYPVPEMEKNFEYITKTYELLNQHLKLGVNIHQAGEWLLDNYYVLEETVNEVRKNLPLKKYVNFIGISTGKYKGYARSYILATEIVNFTDGNFKAKDLKEYLRSYQNKKTLNMEEIWDINLFFKIALIERIKDVCTKIFASQMQKIKVESIIERLIENKSKDELKFKTPSREYLRKIQAYSENKYTFIEYMSYRLKQYGKRAIPYLNILEEEISKQGLSLAEVIKKEHFDIALKKVSIGNSIKSIHSIQRMNFLEIFESINGVEEILRKDPSKVYENMDYKTKEYYRVKVKEIAKKTKISEIYVAKKVVELANQNKDNEKKGHIGYYLISDGKSELYKSLKIKCNDVKKQINLKINLYIVGIYFVSTIISVLIAFWMYKASSNLALSIIEGLLIFIPVTEIVIKILQSILGKIVKPTLLPKMDFSKGIDKENTSMVVIPTIIENGEKVKELAEKLEVFYLANKSENIYFTILGDCTSSKSKICDEDEEIKQFGIEEIKKLNEKYPKNGAQRFNFIYRKRVWNEKEKCYLGWERKRGLLTELNEYLSYNASNDKKKRKDNTFLINTIEDSKEKYDIKYVITLDADTDLSLNSGIELIEAMAHPLNKPVIDKEKRVVTEGFGIIQPRVGIDLETSMKSIFAEIFAGDGGVDSYTNAISDIYQDNFGEGIYTGKGIYNLAVFSEVMKDRIPENTVLSHDLLEGCYLRCGLASDIMLLDGYPSGYSSYITRMSRWIRGDIQIIPFLKDKSLSKLSKYKIIDNIRRSLIEIVGIINLIILFLAKLFRNINITGFTLIIFLSIIISSIIDVVNYIVFRKENIKTQKKFTKKIDGLSASIYRGLISFANFPSKAYISFTSIVKTIYRMKISKVHLLEWVTAEEAEKKGKKDLASVYKMMFPNIVFGIVGLIFSQIIDTNFICTLAIALISIIWLSAPFIMWYISNNASREDKRALDKLNKEEKEYAIKIAKDTWSYFSEYMNEENNFLPPDNYQESRKDKIVKRTSSTNIGLGFLTIMSAFDLRFIDLDKAIEYIEKGLNTVESLDKWHGHLYNWYNTKTLTPLIPRFISTVDSGNFVGYMFTLRGFIEQELYKKEREDLKERLAKILNEVKKLIDDADFKYLYSEENRLLSIGFNIEENKLADTYYDLLASEARQASLVAIAKKDVEAKHWNNLSRTLTKLDKYKGLISWSGTAFEYLMPNINIKKYKGSLLDESCKFMIMSQQKYSNKLGIPWGISESAFNLKDLNSNYQYKSFGVPWLGLKRGLADEMVVSSYGTILAITDYPKEVIQNLKRLEAQDMYGKYGFYESIDYTPNRLPVGKKNAVVKTYMAHHQALILLSINNLINDNILQKRFMNNPEIKAIDILLQERMPRDMLITKEKKEKTRKIKYVGYDNYIENTYAKISENLRKCDVISNGDYMICIDDRGFGFSKYKDILVNKYKETRDYPQGIFFYVKNIRTNKIWSANFDYKDVGKSKYEVTFAEDKAKFVKQKYNIETDVNIIAVENLGVEIRSIKLKNNSNSEETLEVSSIFEPVLSRKEEDIAHPAFNNLFLKYSLSENGDLVVKRNKRGNSKEMYLACNLFSSNDDKEELEFEIDASKAYKMLKNGIPFSKEIGLVTDPIIALKRKVKLKPDEEITLNLIISVSDNYNENIENLQYFKIQENVKREFNISRAKAEEEARYLSLSRENLNAFQNLLPYIMFQNPLKSLYIRKSSKQRVQAKRFLEVWNFRRYSNIASCN